MLRLCLDGIAATRRVIAELQTELHTKGLIDASCRVQLFEILYMETFLFEVRIQKFTQASSIKQVPSHM
jgi:hypothetical protein